MFNTFILCIQNTFHTWIYRKMKNLCDNHSFIGSYFIHQHIYPCVKHVFNAWYLCAKCTNLWMNELYTIFIINSSHVKFVVSLNNCFTQIFYLNNVSTNSKFVELNNNNNFTQRNFCIFNKNNQSKSQTIKSWFSTPNPSHRRSLNGKCFFFLPF
jgi:hypothetical protein